MPIGGFFLRRGAAENYAQLSQAADPAAPISKTDARRRLQLLDEFENASLGWFWATDARGRLIYISASAARHLGRSADDIVGAALTSLFELDEDDEGEKVERPLAFLLGARNTIADLPVRVVVDGKEAWWSICGKPQLDRNGKFRGYRGSAKDITAIRENQRHATRLAQYDSLTGLANRHRMTKRLTAMLAAYKAAKRSCALLMLDLDRFKQVNDTLGHQAGDELLKQVAQRLGRLIGKQGDIGRLGGDEFQIILPDMDDRGKLGELAARVIQMVSQPYSINGSRAIIGTSVGIAIAPYDGIETDDLVHSADLALYAAKGGGRGQFRFYSGDLKEGANRRRRIEEDLRDAIDQGLLGMHYQPIIEARTHGLAGLEALMRWEHPERGWISPADFIPIAEETGLSSELSALALRQACADAAKWPGNLAVAVNISAAQFADENLPKLVRNALAASGIKPERLELEITESVLIGYETFALDMFRRLKLLGVKLVLDDFGTGYSSLGYLRHAPFDKIKIDRSLINGLTERDNNNAAIVTTIVSLAKALNMDVVAEGVEALDELEALCDFGVSHIQGWVYSKAQPHDEMLALLEDGGGIFAPKGPARHRARRKTMFRQVGVIHEDHRYDAVMRNLSKTGARIEGLMHVPEGTQLVVDFGEGQLAVATVRRSQDHWQGLQFEEPLVSDGAGGLCTRHRISPYALAAAGMPLQALPQGSYPLVGGHVGMKPESAPAFMQLDLMQLRDQAAFIGC